MHTWRCPDCRCLIVADEDALPKGELKLGRLTLDYDTQQVFIDGQEYKVPRAPFAILGAIAEVKGRIVSRNYLLEVLASSQDKTPDDYCEASIKLIDVHIFNLRKQLGRDVIETVWGRGVRIGPEITGPKINTNGDD